MINNQNNSDKLSIGNSISIFYRIGSSFLSQKYDKYNIGFGQYQFLLKLYLEDGLSQEELTKKVYVDKATTARSISKLSENGYVTVNIDESDKRIHRVYLTDYAKSIKNEILQIATEWEEKLLNSLDTKEIEQLYEIFDKIARNNNWINKN